MRLGFTTLSRIMVSPARSSEMGSSVRRWRVLDAAVTAMVWSCRELRADRRAHHGARPLRRVMLATTAVSSQKTGASASQSGMASNQAWRPAFATLPMRLLSSV